MSDYIAGGRAVKNVPRTTGAPDTDAIVEAIARRTGPPAAWWGIAMLLASEGVLFAAMIGTYFYLRFNSPHWPQFGDPKPDVAIPLILVACLTLSSIPMQLAWRAARTGRLVATRLLILAALVIQAGYFAYEVTDYADQLKKLPISHDAYSSIYYTVLGADHAHVLVGMLLNVWLLLKLSRGLTMYRANAVQAIGWYWHFVNLLTWVVIGALVSANA